MKKILTFLLLFAFFLSVQNLISQTYKLQEGFESSDSIHLPQGWSVQNQGNYYPDPFTNWTVRDTGLSLPGLDTAKSRAHTGSKSCEVTWWVSYDTSGSQHLPLAWLVTKRIDNIQNGDKLKFWAAGGSPRYRDSIQVWLSATDSLAGSMVFKLASINWDTGTAYGHFTQYVYDLSGYAGNSVYIGFLYDTDCQIDGYVVFIDDVEVSNPIGIQPIGSNVPGAYRLGQNYPNPFNPVTYIEFDLPKSEFVNIKLYNILGEEVKTLLNESKAPGSYRVDFDASSLSSGTYFYRLTAGSFAETKKMVLVK